MNQGPIGLEAIDQRLIDDMHKKGLNERYLRYLPEGKGFLLAEFGGDDKASADARAREALVAVQASAPQPSFKIYDDPDQEQKLWEVRKSGLGATARIPGSPDTWEGWEDSAVPPDKMGDYLRELRPLMAAHGYDGAFYGHFGQGCLHTRINFDLTTERGIANYRSFIEEAASLVIRFGGSLSGEHGDGQSRAELLPRMFGPELVQAFREFKAIWDPAGRMNPGKVVDPYDVDDNLRLGADFRAPDAPTHFAFRDDDGNFTRAALRCVGVGECRREHGGTMCPSYRATREEKHSTRGRAHLLFEMMRGTELDGWRDDAIRESLDLCLACKGCKHDCPVNVDVATYKAEFLAHHYEGRLRPRAAYSMGLIHWWARIAARVPGLANLSAQSPATAPLFKRLGGIAPQRKVPAFAERTFKALWRRRPARNVGRPSVMLWPDTFNNHFFPQTALAAAEVLEALDFQVVVPEDDVCCGRPLYDFGMLETARSLLQKDLGALRPAIEQGIPVVALEPSCLSVFRDEMTNLLPDDPAARRLKEQTRSFAQFVLEHSGIEEVARLERQAVVHGHCHEKALLGMDSEVELLRRLGIDAQLLDTGCCGMAGSFGFEAGEKYRVSTAIGELDVLPKVRQAAPDALVVADGFSCREQIDGSTTRRALHVAEVARMAVANGRRAVGQAASVDEPSPRPARLGPGRPAAVAALAIAAMTALLVPRRSRATTRRLPFARALVGTLATIGVLAGTVAGLAAQLERTRR
jgi:Fe-S oxidoreductase